MCGFVSDGAISFAFGVEQYLLDLSEESPEDVKAN
jgi:hypothetical protein